MAFSTLLEIAGIYAILILVTARGIHGLYTNPRRPFNVMVFVWGQALWGGLMLVVLTLFLLLGLFPLGRT